MARILFVAHGFPPLSQGGVQNYVQALAAELGTTHDIAVAYPARGDEPPIRGEPFTRYRLPPATRPADPQTRDAFRDALSDFNPNVVHFHHLDHLTPDLVTLAKHHGTRVAFTLHDLTPACRTGFMVRRGTLCASSHDARLCKGCAVTPRGGFIHAIYHALRGNGPGPDGMLARVKQRSPLAPRAASSHGPGAQAGFNQNPADRRNQYRDLLAACDVVLSPSRFNAQRLADENILDATSVTILPLGHEWAGPHHAAAVAATPPPRFEPHKLRFGFVGSFTFVKGARLLIDAFRDVRGPHLSLHLHGASPLPIDTADLVDALRRDTRIRWHGPYGGERMADVFASFDLLVFPSLCWENQPRTLQEAAIFRRPVIAGGYGGQGESLALGDYGIALTPLNVETLRDAMQAAADEPATLALKHHFPPIASLEAHARDLVTHLLT